MEALSVGGLPVELRRSARRKTVEVVVERDGRVALLCPESLTEEAARGAIERRIDWIHEKRVAKRLLAGAGAAALPSEGVAYLGRRYRVEVVDSEAESTRLVGGRLVIMGPVSRAERALVAWYRSRGQRWIERRLPRFTDAEPSGVRVRDLGSRWGACRSDGTLEFHWKLMRLAPRLVDYVLAHEVAHLQVPDHRRAFWTVLEGLLPDYGPRRDDLAREGARMGWS